MGTCLSACVISKVWWWVYFWEGVWGADGVEEGTGPWGAGGYGQGRGQVEGEVQIVRY